VRFAVDAGVLRFGEFKTKAGRLSPYFFNAGLFDDGAKLGRLAEFYARRLIASGLQFDMLFGPAYKGITLAAAVAIELARQGRNVPFAYNRKEAKDHGEGGTLVGAKVAGRVLIIDDVMSAGTSVRESIAMIRAAGATPCGVAIALDRQEKATDGDVRTHRMVGCAVCPAAARSGGGGHCDAFRLAAILAVQRRRGPERAFRRRGRVPRTIRSLNASFGHGPCPCRRHRAGGRRGHADGGFGAGLQKSAGIYSCIDANGKRLTSDRPIPECASGTSACSIPTARSVRSCRRCPPPMNAQRSRRASRKRRSPVPCSAEASAATATCCSVFRARPRTTRRARRRWKTRCKALRISEARLAALEKERKPLLDESEFYVGKQMPLKLRQQIDGNDAATEAQRDLLQNQKAELVRVNELYDLELERLRKLWSGAQPGSLGADAACRSGLGVAQAAAK
jgi:orotate phosphoribosyltransferase